MSRKSRRRPRHGNDVLPTERDFNPWGPGALDEESAWRNFGGLTLAEACARFKENPLYYQEDFMFMGGKAFAFYFPVIEGYLRDCLETDSEGDDRQAWILAKAIQSQLQAGTAHHVAALADRVMALSALIQNNIELFGDDEESRKRVAAAWQELEGRLRLLGKPDDTD